MPDTTAAFDAVAAGDREELERLLEADPDLAPARDANGVSLLTFAAYHRQPQVVAALASRRDDLDLFEAIAAADAERLVELADAVPESLETRSPDGWTPLHLAAFLGRAEAVELLLERGAGLEIRSTNQMRNTPLHAAVAGGERAIIERLVAAGAAVDARQHAGYTVLHAAAKHGDDGLVELFLEAGADPSIVTDEGADAADLAAAERHAELAARLRNAGESPASEVTG